MTVQPLVDLSPLLQVMLIGLLLAFAALGWMWLRHKGTAKAGWIRPLTFLTLFLTFDLIVFGAFTRLTDSGLGCPDWPGCYGNASPTGAVAHITAAQSAMPSGPVTHGKAWVEMIHRYLATGVGALLLVLAAANLRARYKADGAELGAGIGWPIATLVWVCIQGAFGALTVTMKLFPAIVTLHLLGGLILLALLTVQAERLGRIQSGRPQVLVSPATRVLMLVACVLLGLQVALGGWVSTNYAVLACTDFPMCQNSWWPEMKFAQGFQIWRELGLTQSGESITFAALTAIHYVHRSMAVAVVLAFGLLAWRLKQVRGLRHQSRWIAALVVTQVATGMANAVLGWPLAAALMHTAGAAALVLLLTWTIAGTRPNQVRAGVFRPTVMDLSV